MNEPYNRLKAKDPTKLNVLEIIILSETNDALQMAGAAMLEDMNKQLIWLNCLESAGVDNWEGCDFAREAYQEQIGEE